MNKLGDPIHHSFGGPFTDAACPMCISDRLTLRTYNHVSDKVHDDLKDAVICIRDDISAYTDITTQINSCLDTN
jgi:hypothetical protein